MSLDHLCMQLWSNLPTQSSSHPVLQHFKPDGQELSSVQKFSTSLGHSAGVGNTGQTPGAEIDNCVSLKQILIRTFN